LGRYASVVVVAEGAIPKPGTITVPEPELDIYGNGRLGGISNVLASEIEHRTGFESRVTILGHMQRGGTPTAYDRVLATRYGMAAIDAVNDGAFGQMVALQADRIVRVPLSEAVGEDKLKKVPHDLFEVGEVFRL
jgi:6-phosphofructokinase 1